MPARLFTLDNGLTLAFERSSGPGFAFDLRVPRGSIHDPPGQEGSASVLEEWLYRGAGTRGSRALQDALDDLGVRRSGGCGFEATRLAASGLGGDLYHTLALYADLLQRPHLSAEELPALLDLARQDLESYQDNPADRLGLMVRAQTLAGSGYAWPSSGTLEGLGNITAQGLRAFFAGYGAAGSILAVVADQEAEQVLAWVQERFGGWQAGAGAGHSAAELLSAPRPHLGLRGHLSLDSQQTHLTLMGQGVAPTSPDWLGWQLALTALSGGSASRLFHAVREERGLAYSVAAGPQLAGHTALLTAYAASTPERAQETLDVILAELERWKRGLEQAEFERAKNALIASTVFGSESIRARSAALTRDLSLFGRVRSPQSVRAALEKLSLDGVNDLLQRYHYGPLSVFTAGPAPLEVPQATTMQVNHV